MIACSLCGYANWRNGWGRPSRAMARRICRSSADRNRGRGRSGVPRQPEGRQTGRNVRRGLPDRALRVPEPGWPHVHLRGRAAPGFCSGREPPPSPGAGRTRDSPQRSDRRDGGDRSRCRRRSQRRHRRAHEDRSALPHRRRLRHRRPRHAGRGFAPLRARYPLRRRGYRCARHPAFRQRDRRGRLRVLHGRRPLREVSADRAGLDRGRRRNRRQFLRGPRRARA